MELIKSQLWYRILWEHCIVIKKLDKLETARIKIRDLECITFKGWLKDFGLVNLRYIGI